MGLAASSGHDNDDLIDKLIDANIVVTHRVEIALRLVDRRRFFPVEGRYVAYKDLAWKSDFGSPGRIHISAPCIYGNVLECLDLREGNSFLNVGSGTGYLSTVAGYLLGSNGTNHGVEIYPNIVEYARSLVVETLHCPETQCYDWAVPEFSCGNGLHLSPFHYSKYDRVYCGAAVPASHRRILWELLKIGGILVMPYEDQLLQVRRQEANVFEVKIITSVSFSDFIPPTEVEISKELYSNAPSFKTIPTLQYLCALSIRKIIRVAVAATHQIHIRNFVNQQPQRIRENHVIVEFRDGEEPMAHRGHFEIRRPPFREILAIVGADFIDEDENVNNNEVEEINPERRRRLVRDRFRMVWFRHHLRAHIANRAVRRRRPHEREAQEGNAGTENGRPSNGVEVNENENLEYSGSGSVPATTTDTSVTTELNTDSTSTTGRSKKRSLNMEHESESSLSVKRRNDDDDDDGFRDRERMETNLVNDSKAQSIPKQDLQDKNKSDGGSMVTSIAQETLMKPEKSANQKSEENVPKYLEEVENSKDLKFVEGAVGNDQESVVGWEEMVEQLRDMRRKEAESSGNIVMKSISKHKRSNFRSNLLDQMDCCQNSIRARNSNSCDCNHDEEYGQGSSKSTDRSFQVQNQKIHNEANNKKSIINLTSSNTLCNDEMENILKVDHEFLSPKNFNSKNDELMWQNNRLYKNGAENSAERYDMSEDGNLVDTGDSSGKSGILRTTNSELERDSRHLDTSVEEHSDDNGNDDDDDDVDDGSDEDDDEEEDGDDNDDDDDDDDDDGDDDDGNTSSSSSDAEYQENIPEHNSDDPCYRVSSQDQNELYLAGRQTARSTTDAVSDQFQASNHGSMDRSDSSADDHDAMDYESMSQHRCCVDEPQTEEEKKREQARLEERGRQLNDIHTFAALFEGRIMELPLNRALKEYIKCLC